VRRTIISAATVALVAAPLSLAAPAVALTTPTFSAVDTSTPGHAKVVITAPDATYVAYWLRSTTLNVRVSDPVFAATANGEAAVDLETWGVDSAQVMARACTDQDYATCDSIVLSEAFAPTTVNPVVTWPEDDTVGALDSYEPEVSDPDGGGTLVAVWGSVRTVLTPGTPVALPLATEGVGTIKVLRCSAFAANVCQPTGLTHAIEVNRVLSGGGQASPDYLNPDTAPLVLQLGVSEALDQTFTFQWHVANAAGDVIPGVGGVIENLTANGSGLFQSEVDVSAVADGKFTLLGRLSYTDADFGEVGRNVSLGNFILDRVAPAVGSTTFSSPSLYPYKDGFLDNVTVDFADAENYAAARVIVTDENAAKLRTLSRPVDSHRAHFVWDGQDGSGNVVPAGTYTMTAYAFDAAGNTSTPRTWTVKVVRQRLVWTTFDHTYTAAGTLTQVHVGSCSAVVKPSSYRWKGSIELRSDSKCNRSGAPAVAETVHSVSLPAGTFVAGVVDLNVYGGSTIDRLSEATMWVRNGSGSWRSPVTLDQDVDWQPFRLNHVALLLGPAHRLTWRVRVDRNSDKYSLGKFKVHMSVGSLVAE